MAPVSELWVRCDLTLTCFPSASWSPDTTNTHEPDQKYVLHENPTDAAIHASQMRNDSLSKFFSSDFALSQSLTVACSSQGSQNSHKSEQRDQHPNCLSVLLVITRGSPRAQESATDGIWEPLLIMEVMMIH